MQQKIAYKAILSIGNPGERYYKTRHNIGHIFLDYLAQKKVFSFFKESFLIFKKINFSNKEIIIAKSNVFMNESIVAFNALKKKFKLKTSDILIVHDDSDILFKKFKISFAKNSAGHHGIESIISSEKTNKFWRLRFGVRPEKYFQKKIKTEKFILKEFSEQEKNLLPIVFEKAIKTIKLF